MSETEVVSRLRSWIGAGRLITERTLAVEDIATTLDDRETADFDGEWKRVYRQIGEVPLANDVLEELDALAAETFRRCYEHADGGQLAPYVSDDFDLLARALLLNFDDAWLRGLWHSYAHERFPRGVLDVENAGPIGTF